MNSFIDYLPGTTNQTSVSVRTRMRRECKSLGGWKRQPGQEGIQSNQNIHS